MSFLTSWRAALVAIALILAMAGGYILLLAHELGQLAPPAGQVDLRTFLDEMPAPFRGFELSVGDIRYIELHGPLPSKSALPSGPPAYVFDAELTLVDWCSDVGDNGKFVNRWHVATRRELKDEELQALLSSK